MSNKVSAVIVLYNPDVDNLRRNIDAVSPQVRKVILVDNSEMENHLIGQLKGLANIDIIHNGLNLGVAKAQNIGIKMAVSEGDDFVLILDQDSTPSGDMVDILIKDYNKLLSQKVNVGIIGPEPINTQTQQPYEPRIRKRRPITDDLNLLEEKEIISSGSLTPISSFEKVGMMDEFLFIDGVDHEWCWRAAKCGLKCVISKNARLEHMLGEGDKKLLGVRVAVPSSFRVYYQYRNFFYLLRKSYVPVYWKMLNAVKYFVKFFYYPMFISPRMAYLRNSIRGIKEGISYKTQ